MLFAQNARNSFLRHSHPAAGNFASGTLARYSSVSPHTFIFVLPAQSCGQHYFSALGSTSSKPDEQVLGVRAKSERAVGFLAVAVLYENTIWSVTVECGVMDDYDEGCGLTAC